MWRKFQYFEAEQNLRWAMEEVLYEYQFVHNKLAYKMQFEKTTGLQVRRRAAWVQGWGLGSRLAGGQACGLGAGLGSRV